MKKLPQFPKLPNQFPKINFIHLLLLIIGTGLFISLYQIWDKKFNETEDNALEILKDLSQEEGTNTNIKNIQTTLISVFPTFYKLKVTYKNTDKTKIYNLVDDQTFKKISNAVYEKHNYNISEILPAPTKPEPDFGFSPLFFSLKLCFLLFLGYHTLDMIKSATGKIIDQFNDKNKTQPDIPNAKKNNQITFKDVAGAEEEKEEMQELVDFLKEPKKYSDIGARIPKGILLSGPPGTGKTLLAKALSGEAGVPFFATSGSEFVEMFVGLGASRIRKLFETAKKNAPCIIFVDEIDTLARKRRMSHGNSEQEQTLNQLLIELDGYNQNTGVIVIAATNRPDFLDAAILRPGRFDRHFIINLPTVKDREAILKLHALNKKIDPEVSLEELAKQTPGFSGAQLEGILNEAALLTARKGLKIIDKKIISEAVDRILIGPAKKSKKYSQKEKKLVAYHESGHAIIGLKLSEAKKAQKITIIPRGNAGGYNLMLREEETFFLSKKQLLAEITVCLGGRAAEELFLDDVSNGAYADFKQATQIARMMVTKLGMSSIGLTQFSEEDQQFHRSFSDPKALEIDQAIQDIISNCYSLAKKIISENKKLLSRIAYYLIEIETLSKKDIEEIEKTGKVSWFEEEIKENQKNKEKEQKKTIIINEKKDISFDKNEAKKESSKNKIISQKKNKENKEKN
ncbi:ATP-dependent metallopeptidase HflB family protein [Candidatus Phytoplasma oryzae]|uniref:ATP-dependent zinc metalloprotease FtsH n=1 Tax=Candidatus Phytoplasma oryzae TaxID=203274 RepID=A0A139JQV3_9MOLU|nr:ATP-dependent zinc metalloprotease FtsH [Candidatus Phytoplasma oryzae]KXT29361.1 ATP-dependent metallopeptidase HflB family protein [Candidatus Phytoplasma oryzae]RAM57946.1 cell division protein FtsH [Candidatus Phytoplasma oryzae]